MKLFLTGTILIFLFRAVSAQALELSDLSRAANDASREINITESQLKIVTELPRSPKILPPKDERPDHAIVDVPEEEPTVIADGQ